MKTTMRKIRFLSFLAVCLPLNIFSQSDILLENSSFEGNAAAGKTPWGWFDCGSPGNSPTDLHDANSSFFNVEIYPADGVTCLGMVTREDGTIEGVGQKLAHPLKKDQWYRLSFYACYNQDLSSMSQTSQTIVSFSNPVVIVISGGNNPCESLETLAISDPIDQVPWNRISLLFKPNQDLNYITIQSEFDPNFFIHYNGNVLMDDLSFIQAIPASQIDSAEMMEILYREEPDFKALQNNELLNHLKFKYRPSGYDLEFENIYLVDRLIQMHQNDKLSASIARMDRATMFQFMSALKFMDAEYEAKYILKVHNLVDFRQYNELMPGKRKKLAALEEEFEIEQDLNNQLMNYVELHREKIIAYLQN